MNEFTYARPREEAEALFLRAGYLVPFSSPILARDVERITLAY